MIRFPLALAFAGLGSFFLALALKLSDFEFLTELISKIGSILLLCAFLLIFFSGLVLLLQITTQLVIDYFSKTSRSQRELLYYFNQWEQQQSIFEFKKAKLLYNHQQKRKLLFNKVNKR